jgi:acetyl esterase/lipase
LLAATGVTAITYTTGTNPGGDARTVLDYVRHHAAALGIDCERVGAVAFSGNVPNALSLLIAPGAIPIRAAALLWGFMLDIDGSTGVAAAATRWGFVNPTLGKTIDDVPAATPLFIGRAGRDDNPGLNQAIDAFVSAALRRNLPLTVVNHPSGPHAFDIIEDSAASRAVIRQVLDFLRAALVEHAV